MHRGQIIGTADVSCHPTGLTGSLYDTSLDMAFLPVSLFYLAGVGGVRWL
jgi:hypothetical protein